MLAIWNRAKGKQRDALLWGDEVGRAIELLIELLLKTYQIEYLVVNYKAEEEKVTLSLRQADILQALAQDEDLCTSGGCVPDLQNVGCVQKL